MPSARRLLATQLANGLLRPGADEEYGDRGQTAWREIDWLALQRSVVVGDTRVNYVDSGGSLPPLLLLHGLGGNWQNWLLNIPAFMGTYRVVAVDLPGFGRSEMPAEPISIQGYARCLDAFSEHLGVDAAAVAGNSMGGFIGAELAVAFPPRVERLVLVSAAGLSIEHQRREPLLSLARASQMTAGWFLGRSELMARRARLRRAALQFVLRYPERLSAPLTWELLQGMGRPGYADALEALMSYSFRDRLPEIECPTLIVWGRNDMLVPVGDANEFAQLIGANARKVVFHDTGHTPMIERPGRFNRTLADFLSEEPAEPESYDLEGTGNGVPSASTADGAVRGA